MLFRQISHIGDVLFGDNEQVALRMRSNIVYCAEFLILRENCLTLRIYY